MKVGIFPIMAGRKAGGVETYERSLIASLDKLDEQNHYTVFAPGRDTLRAIDPDSDNIDVHLLKPSNRVISMSTTLPVKLARSTLDVFHATFAPPVVSPKKLVFTMHCMSQFTRPELYPWPIRLRLSALTRLGMKRADLVLCVSQNVYDHARDDFGISTDRLCVVHNGINRCFQPVTVDARLRHRLQMQYGIDRPFLLFTGRLEARKNVAGLVRAFDCFRRETGSKHRLVLAGRMNWTSGELRDTIDQLQLWDDVIITGHLPIEQLPALYSAADAFVFPSFWEGFGIPVLEAMACGTPVVASNVSSIPEVAGGAARLVNPHRIGDIAEAIHDVTGNARLRESMRQKGFLRAAQFSWDSVARRTLEAYERVAG
jgi:glycosyltransferase involved in cell wall biosynthesis